MRRHPLPTWLAVVAVFLVPAAVVLACTPQAYLTVDRASYRPGERIGVQGRFFVRDTALALSVSPGGQVVATPTTDGNGAFDTSFAAPAPGTYTLLAKRADGRYEPGLPARTSFRVRAGGDGKPPRPAVSSHGRTLLAKRGSYCWSRRLPGGGGRGVCADAPGPPRTKRAIPVHPGGRVRVDARLPAKELTVLLLGGARLVSRREDDSGRHWSFRAPRGVWGRRDVLIAARFVQGRGVFGVGLRAHRHTR